jgi:2-keto-4-pentenoate hydratase/2-oxohepta-3-ene-1,7-dioic acid hydratase in catechol pathway
MAQLITFSVDGQKRPGAVDGDRVLDLQAAGLPGGEMGDLLEIARGGDPMIARAKSAIADWSAQDYPLDMVKLEAPIQHPPKVIGIGLNYIDHCREAKMAVPTEPVVFTKYSTSVTGPYDDVHWYEDVCHDIDYEVELGVVIGKKASRVSESSALDYVMGYTIVNDVSARDLQLSGAGQWDIGKSLDSFCPFGPAIVTTNEIENPHNLDLTLSVNGDIRQSSNTSNLIFKIPALISYLSQGITLLPGDLIATGTPFGVALGMKDPVWLKNGDVCEAQIEKLGFIRNTMKKRS